MLQLFDKQGKALKDFNSSGTGFWDVYKQDGRNKEAFCPHPTPHFNVCPGTSLIIKFVLYYLQSQQSSK